MSKSFLKPVAALAALAATTPLAAAEAKVEPEKASASARELAKQQLGQAVERGVAIYSMGADAFAFTIQQAADGTLFAQHRSHYSHSSHSSHVSHSSHYSGRG